MTKKKIQIENREHFQIYLFGSVVYSENPNDVDVAIIYDSGYIEMKDAISYRREVVKKISQQVIPLPVDAILLSIKEEKEMDFLSNAKHIKI
jgi:predicted nucleotidyltransferase